jgi:hypothetical protein
MVPGSVRCEPGDRTFLRTVCKREPPYVALQLSLHVKFGFKEKNYARLCDGPSSG